MKVAKNRLAKIALEGTDVASIGAYLKGPTVIAYSSDPVAASKVAADFAKANEKFVILGGAMGKTALDPNGVKALASAAVARRAPGQDRRPPSGAGDQDRAARQRPGGEGGPRGSGLCQQERSCNRGSKLNWFESKKELDQWLICPKIVDELSALTVLEAADLAKMLEEKWGVSAAAAVAVAGRLRRRRRPGRGEDRVHGRPRRRRRQEDRGHQGGPCAHGPRPQGSQGPRRGRAEGRQGRRDQG